MPNMAAQQLRKPVDKLSIRTFHRNTKMAGLMHGLSAHRSLVSGSCLLEQRMTTAPRLTRHIARSDIPVLDRR
jgi:hypothetical protein